MKLTTGDEKYVCDRIKKQEIVLPTDGSLKQAITTTKLKILI